MQKEESKAGRSKALLLSKISHELKGPIHGISGLAKFLNDNWSKLEDDTKRRYTGDIYSASNVLNELMESLLGFFRFDLKVIKFNFGEADLVKETKVAIERSKIFLNPAKKHLSIKLNTNLVRSSANLDSFWYKQLLSNLLTNAVNYSDEGTILVNIELDNSGGKEEYIVSVQDQGVGINDSELETIFQAFNQGSGTGFKNGFGLGLTICKEVVSAHGGRIWAVNNEDRGATIFFSIPRG